MQEFITNLVDWLPQLLRNAAEMAIYFALLTALMMIPLILWLGYAVASTNRKQARAVSANPAS